MKPLMSCWNRIKRPCLMWNRFLSCRKGIRRWKGISWFRMRTSMKEQLIIIFWKWIDCWYVWRKWHCCFAGPMVTV
jgi:hypothetical protein